MRRPARALAISAALAVALAPGAAFATSALAESSSAQPAGFEVDDPAELTVPGTGATLSLAPTTDEAEAEIADVDDDEPTAALPASAATQSDEPDAAEQDATEPGDNNDEQDATEASDSHDEQDATDASDSNDDHESAPDSRGGAPTQSNSSDDEHEADSGSDG